MLDLRVLRDIWTEDGARSVFAELVNQCVLSVYKNARAIRPDPGDEGIDTFVGEFDTDLKVYQAKYFCDRIGPAQQSQIRESWKSCVESSYFSRLTLWTLCLPIELSIDEMRWWQTWAQKEIKKHRCQIELWSKTQFVAFSVKPEVERVFAIALQRGHKHDSADAALDSMRFVKSINLRKLPNAEHLKNAIFVRKLERAGVDKHTAARGAFYNFELLRSYIEQGNNAAELAELEDLQEKVLDLWESAYNEREPGELGRQFYASVDRLIESEDQRKLRTWLPAQTIHKKGAIHFWADACLAGWTADFETIGKEAEPK